MSKSKQVSLRDVLLDLFKGSVMRSSSGGHPSRNKHAAKYEAERKKLKKRLKKNAADSAKRRKRS